MNLSTQPGEMLFQMFIWENEKVADDEVADDEPTVPFKAEVEEIVEGMIENGANAREIAEETPLSRTTAWRRIQRYAERQVREEKKREEKKREEKKQ